MTSFTQAAASYFGLTPQVTEIGTSQDGQMLAVFTIALRDEDIAAIVARMQNIAQVEQEMPLFTPVPDRAHMREEYNALSAAERGKYGSFARYCVERTIAVMARVRASLTAPEIDLRQTQSAPMRTVHDAAREQVRRVSEGTAGRTVTHVDAPEPEEAAPELPAAVWVPQQELSPEQIQCASDFRRAQKGNWGTMQVLMQVGLLTPEQRAKYGVEP